MADDISPSIGSLEHLLHREKVLVEVIEFDTSPPEGEAEDPLGSEWIVMIQERESESDLYERNQEAIEEMVVTAYIEVAKYQGRGAKEAAERFAANLRAALEFHAMEQ